MPGLLRKATLCLAWSTWREHNGRILDGMEIFELKLKGSGLKSLFVWLADSLREPIWLSWIHQQSMKAAIFLELKNESRRK